MKIKFNQSGFSAVEGLIAAIVIIGVLSVGLLSLNRINKSDSKNSSQTTESATATDVKTAPNINSKKDLDTAINTLDSTDPSSSSDNSQLDSQLNF